MQVLIVADDLTGALDSIVAFADMGMRSTVLRHPAALGGFDFAAVDVLAVSTGTRECSEEAAIAAIRLVVSALADERPRYVFKKIDSRLKGHVGREAVALAEGLGMPRLLVAPAIPDMGRHVRDGAVTGAGVSQPIPIAACFPAHDLAIVVPDIAVDEDFDAVLGGMDGDEGVTESGTLLVGARGLASALARRLPAAARRAPPASLPAPAVFAIGSRDPITEVQVARVAAAPNVKEVLAKNGKFEDLPSLDAPITLARLAAGTSVIAASLAGQQFAEGLARALEANMPATLLGCGGETANAILERLRVERLDVIAEIMPGVPLSQATICGKTVCIITKSGGFGGEDTLLRLTDLVEIRHSNPLERGGLSRKPEQTVSAEIEDRP